MEFEMLHCHVSGVSESANDTRPLRPRKVLQVGAQLLEKRSSATGEVL